jgi:hypothetical protein
MANIQLKQDHLGVDETVTYRLIFVLGFTVVLAIALVGSLTRMPWRRWLPGSEHGRSLFGSVQAAVYSFMSHTL